MVKLDSNDEACRANEKCSERCFFFVRYYTRASYLGLTHLVQVFLPLLFVLHVADPRREVPEADVGVLRLCEHTQTDIEKERVRNKPMEKHAHIRMGNNSI